MVWNPFFRRYLLVCCLLAGGLVPVAGQDDAGRIGGPPGPPPGFSPAEPTGMVVAVEVVGHRNVSEDSVRKHLKTRRDRLFDPQIMREDVRRLYATRLFQNIRTQTRPVQGGVVVIFEVSERPTIGEIKFVGNRYISDRTLLRQSGLVKGESLNIYAVQEARRKVEDYYRSKGHPKTTVEIAEGDRPDHQRVVLLINEGNVERIWDVRFIGNDPALATDARLKTQIQSKPGFLGYLFRGKVDLDKIEQDKQRLTAYYRDLGYFRAEISRELDYDASGKWLTLTFVIDEGPRYRIRDVTVTGNEKFDSQLLLSQLELQAGEYFNLGRMQHDRNMLLDLYGSQGHIFADIRANPVFQEAPGELDLVYHIQEGDVFRVGKINIHIAGEFPHTKKDVILNRLSLRPGDIIDIRKVRESERRLKASQLFETNPSLGEPPRIEIRPPELGELESSSFASSSSSSPSYRGQDPRAGSSRVRDMVLDVFLPLHALNAGR